MYLEHSIRSSCWALLGRYLCCSPSGNGIAKGLASSFYCRVLVAAAVALPDDLVSGLLVLSLLTAPFSLEMAAPLLVLPATNNERRSILRRLVNLGLLSYNSSLQLYTMHTLVRQAARLLVHNLGKWEPCM